MPGYLAQENLPQKAKEMTNLKPNERPIRKRRRHLEALSILCSTVGINIVIACFYGVANVFGFKSADTVLNCAFAFLLASVIFGVLAMITSAPENGDLQASLLSSLRCSLLSKFFGDLFSERKTSIDGNEKSECTTGLPAEGNLLPNATESPGNGNGPVSSKRSDDLSTVRRREDGFCTETSVQDGTLSKLKNRPPETNALLRLNKRPSFLFSQSTISQGPYTRKESSSLTLYDIEGNNGRMQFVPRIQKSIVTEVHMNEKSVHAQFVEREVFPRSIRSGVYPCRERNIDYEAQNYDYHKLALSTGNFRKSQIDDVSEVISKINEMNFLS